MGQRHQIFVIANINGRYRTLACIHHQWLFGFKAIRRCFQLVEIFRAGVNRMNIRTELERAKKIQWASLPHGDKKAVLPFIATCLVVGAALTDRDMADNIHLLPIDMTPEQCDNNDGFTIIDITDPSETRYAFFFDHSGDIELGHDMKDMEGAVPSLVEPFVLLGPLSYVRTYYSHQDITDHGLQDIDRLERRPKVSPDALRSLWPNIQWASVYGRTPSKVTVDSLASSLKEMSLSRVVDQALRGGEDTMRWLDQAEQLPDFLPALRTRLCDDITQVPVNSRMELLCLALKGCEEINLASFYGLRQEELLGILKETSNPVQKHFKTLSLPDMEHLTYSTLESVLTANGIHKLYIGETAKIKGEELLQLAQAASLQSIRFPGLYKRALGSPIREERYHWYAQMDPPLSAFPTGPKSPFPVSQVVYVRQNVPHPVPRLECGGLRWSELAYVDGPDTKLGGVHGSYVQGPPDVTLLPLQDAMLTAADVVEKLPKLMIQLCGLEDVHLERHSYGKGVTGMALSMAFAVTVTSEFQLFEARPNDEQQDDKRISPIPAESYTAWKSYFASSVNCAPTVRKPEPGIWSLYILNECRSPRRSNAEALSVIPEVRYAFVTARSDGTLRVADDTEFIKIMSQYNLENEASSFLEKSAQSWQLSMEKLRKCCFPLNTQDGRDGANTSREAKINTISIQEAEEAVKLIEAYNHEIKEFGEMWNPQI
jgi:hypothetical protein